MDPIHGTHDWRSSLSCGWWRPSSRPAS